MGPLYDRIADWLDERAPPWVEDVGDWIEEHPRASRLLRYAMGVLASGNVARSLIGLPVIREADEWMPRWPDNPDVVFIPGVPRSREPDLADAYPTDEKNPLTELFQQHGLKVRNADEAASDAAFYAPDDVLLPIMAFTAEALASGAGELLADYVRSRVALTRRASRQRTRLFVKVGRIETDKGTVHWFEAEGPPDKVLKAMKKALQRE